jgi:hypothetical protein
MSTTPPPKKPIGKIVIGDTTNSVLNGIPFTHLAPKENLQLQKGLIKALTILRQVYPKGAAPQPPLQSMTNTDLVERRTLLNDSTSTSPELSIPSDASSSMSPQGLPHEPIGAGQPKLGDRNVDIEPSRDVVGKEIVATLKKVADRAVEARGEVKNGGVEVKEVGDETGDEEKMSVRFSPLKIRSRMGSSC